MDKILIKKSEDMKKNQITHMDTKLGNTEKKSFITQFLNKFQSFLFYFFFTVQTLSKNMQSADLDLKVLPQKSNIQFQKLAIFSSFLSFFIVESRSTSPKLLQKKDRRIGNQYAKIHKIQGLHNWLRFQSSEFRSDVMIYKNQASISA